MEKTVRINLPRVRLAYPSLYNTARRRGEDIGRYEATLVMSEEDHGHLLDTIFEAFDHIERASGVDFDDHETCLRFLEDHPREDLRDTVTLFASSKDRPLLLGPGGMSIGEDSGMLYDGAIVDAIVTLVPHVGSEGKKIGAILGGVRHAEDSKPTGIPPVRASDFDDMG